jgi:phosphate:Na+ symporter
VFFLSCLAKTYRYIPIFLDLVCYFIGLSFMKTSMEAQVKVLIFAICSMSLAVFTHWFYHHRIGAISSVTIFLHYALHVGAISLPIAAAII